MNKPGMHKKPRTQRGFSLLELLGALAVASALLIGLVAMMDNSLDDMKGQQASAYQAQVTAAVRRYIDANYGELVSPTSPKRLLADGTPKAVNIGTLIAEGFLPQGFSDRNIYNQQSCALLRQLPLPAPAGQVDALVVTTSGTAIGDKDIAAVAANAGQGSGYIATANGGRVIGASWSMDTNDYRGVSCSGAGPAALTGNDAGHLVSRIFRNGDVRADFLYRNDVGVPELNRMNTPIRMGGNAVAVEGDDCPEAAIAVDANRELLQCSSDGKWTYVSKWKTPVDAYAQLDALPVKRHGDVRMVMGTVNKAFVYDQPSNKWLALAEDEQGNLNVKNNINAGGDLVAQNIRSVQDILSGRDLKVGDVGTQIGKLIVGHSVSIGDTSGVAARNPYAEPQAGDLWAGRDAQAQDEMRTGWLIVEKSATVESVFMNYNSAANWNGAECNIPMDGSRPDRPLDRNGHPYRSWPVGTISAEGGNGFALDGNGNPAYGVPKTPPPDPANTGRTIYCAPDSSSSTGARWRYINQ